MHALIPVKNSSFALVDVEDLDRVIGDKFYLHNGYPATKRCNRRRLLHHILGFKGQDHINRNRLDNRRENFRPATFDQQTYNRNTRCDNTTGTTGVLYHSRNKVWTACIGYQRKLIHIGTFKTKEEAIQARLIKAKELFGDFTPHE